MRLDLMRDSRTEFPILEHCEAVRHLRIWHCKFRTLAPAAKCVNLDELLIAGLLDDSLQFLEPMAQLRYLRIVHMPRVVSLEPLGMLEKLESLSLATSPSWDGANKRGFVDSLEPISKLPRLKHLELFGICPKDLKLEVLKRCPALVSARFSKYPSVEVDQFYAETRVSNEYNPVSTFE